MYLKLSLLLIFFANIYFVSAETTCQIIKDFINQKPLTIKNLGGNINSYKHEYAPSISLDGKRIYFVSGKVGSIKGKDGTYSHDIWYAEKNDIRDTFFLKSKNLDKSQKYGVNSMNTTLNEGAPSIFQDSIMYYTCCNRYSGFGSCDIYKSVLINGSWSKAYNLGNNVNSKNFDTQPSINSLNNRLYFVSTRKGPNSNGDDIVPNYDIWYSDWDFANSEWGKAVNFKEINTSGSESSPFITADGLTIIFISDKIKPNYGGTDFYFSNYDLKTKKWSKPKNLGKNINTENQEMFMTIPASGDVAYFSSKGKKYSNYGELDIFVVYSYKKTLKPVEIVNNNIINKDSKVEKTKELSKPISNTNNNKSLKINENVLVENKIEIKESYDFNYYPNLVDESITVVFTGTKKIDNKLSLTITDIDGKKYIESKFKLNYNELRIDLVDLKAGIYYLKVGDITKTLVKE